MIKTICFTEAAWEDYVWWQRQDQKTLRRINQLIHNACRTPFEGLGKPEPLRESLSGFWSRRIDQANRLVYEDTDRALNVVSCRYHYGEFCKRITSSCICCFSLGKSFSTVCQIRLKSILK